MKNIQEKSRQFLTLNTQNPGENLLSTQEDRRKKPGGKCELGDSQRGLGRHVGKPAFPFLTARAGFSKCRAWKVEGTYTGANREKILASSCPPWRGVVFLVHS